ncbi:MAG: DUF2811 domain-containing protein [Gloeomargarita sp. DG02_4_bins_56]
MSNRVWVRAEIPGELHESLEGYLASHPDWDVDRVCSAALSLFLLQNAENDRRVARVYLDTLFRVPR